MADYDLPRAFARIEDTLIDSMMRNFKHHRAEETAEGYNWTQWQVEQLKAFEEYKAKNRKTFGSQFSSLNTRVAEMLRKTKSDAEYAQEQKILNAIQRGYKPKRTSAQSRAEFFKMNERKMNALVKSTTCDLTKAEQAVLRMSNDKYRKAIFDAQVYMNSGAATYAQAVDMAVKDMLSAGLNCVQYKNGARHTLSDYAEMAIRTANKRAYLRGEGEKAQEWGISTVIINRRHGACGRCADFVGMVFIDDVYAGGKKSDGDYPLLSDAMKAGLFHPRCKDSSSLYIEGISTPPGQEVLPKKSQEELSEIERLEQKTSHGKRMQKMYSRLGKYALDPDNKTAYLNKAESWKKYTEFWQGKHEKALANAVESGIIRLNRTVNRRSENIGAFSNLKMPMQKRTVLRICKKYGIDTKGITFKIQRSEKMLNTPFYGSTDYNNIGRIDLFPNAFIDEEQLVRTILHEKCHYKQLLKYGKKYAQDHLSEMERCASRFEELYYRLLRKRVRV